MKDPYSSLKHFIVQKARVSNKEAVAYILSGRVLVNGAKGSLHQPLAPEDSVWLDNHLLKAPKSFLYLAYYKPRGVESTLNPLIENNLIQALKIPQRVFPVGRLDKESEGLMFLTDNGQILDKIIHTDSHQEKEYVVTVNKPLTPEALNQWANGVVIMGQLTRPAQVQQIDSTTFGIVLTQGLNRQIRRMCYKAGYEVERLIRTRIINLQIGTLAPGEWRTLHASEVESLFSFLPS